MIRFQQVLVGIMLILSTLTVNAQDFEVENSVDEKYTPPKGSIFDTEDRSSGNNKHIRYNYKNAVLFNITSVARGAAALQYERALTKNIVLMGTGGVTLFQDVIKNGILGEVLESERYNFDNSLDNIGLYWGGEIKGFFGEAFNEGYVSFGVRNFDYNLKWTPTRLPLSSNISSTDVAQTFKESNRDFFIGFGFADIISDNLVGDFSVNAGVRRIKSSSFLIEENYDIYSGSLNNSFRIKQTDFVQLVPTFFISYKLGFAFGKK